MPKQLQIPASWRNPASIVGAAIAFAGAVIFLVLLLLEALGFLANPYLGLLIFIAVPLVFLAGLLLIPIGIVRARRRQRMGPAGVPAFGEAGQRPVAIAILLLTLANVAIVALAVQGGVHYMESPAFCGQVCHTPMEPQFSAYRAWPHARVACVDCHIGSGAPAFMRAKLAGTRQLLEVMTNRYDRPIPSPVESLRPARDTCEQCHWPEKFHGDKTKIIREFAEDEANSETATTLRIHVGGGSQRLGVATGIHWHMNLANDIEYIALDAARQQIPYVRLQGPDGVVKEYLAEGSTPEQLASGERRRMDCMDCHNRPSHTFVATPERAVNQAIALGRLDRALPYIRREATAVLKAKHPNRETAEVAISSQLRAFYSREYPDRVDGASLDRAIRAVQAIYSENVFPSMRVDWGTYPNELGHIDSAGCFRCHDDGHKARDGSVIRQDCEICHAIE